jgi:hypothetical protein
VSTENSSQPARGVGSVGGVGAGIPAVSRTWRGPCLPSGPWRLRIVSPRLLSGPWGLESCPWGLESCPWGLRACDPLAKIDDPPPPGRDPPAPGGQPPGIFRVGEAGDRFGEGRGPRRELQGPGFEAKGQRLERGAAIFGARWASWERRWVRPEPRRHALANASSVEFEWRREAAARSSRSQPAQVLGAHLRRRDRGRKNSSARER